MIKPKRYNAEPESVRSKSDKKVKRAAKRYGGKVVPNSGATRIKGDYSLPSFLVEHKYTEKKSYRLDDATWTKAMHEAWMENKDPVMEIETATQHYFVVTPNVFEKIVEVINNAKNNRKIF